MENVYVNEGYQGSVTWGTRVVGPIALGAPGFEFRQEREGGSFSLGNRGDTESKAKRLTYTYDVRNTGIFGVTEQILIQGNTSGGRRKNKTVISHFQYKLWSPENQRETEWIDFQLHARWNEISFHVGDVTAAEGWYLKAIRYHIDKIPENTAFMTEWDGEEKDTFPFFGRLLSTGRQPCSKESEFVSTLEVENLHMGRKVSPIKPTDDREEADLLEMPMVMGVVYTGFVGIPQASNVNVAGSTATVSAGQNNTMSFSVEAGNGPAGYLDEIYLISPFGTPLQHLRVEYELIYKHIQDAPDASIGQPAVTGPFPATSEMKEIYPDAIYYKLDFTGITEDAQKYAARQYGDSVLTRKSFSITPFSSIENHMHRISAKMLILAETCIDAKEAGKTIGGDLIWLRSTCPAGKAGIDYLPCQKNWDRYNLTGDPFAILKACGMLAISE